MWPRGASAARARWRMACGGVAYVHPLSVCLGSGEKGGTQWIDSGLDSPRSDDEGAQWLSLQRKEAYVLEGGGWGWGWGWGARPDVSCKCCSLAT